MTDFRTVRVAAVQATPAILDARATVAKTIALLEQAAERGAELAVLPETFVPLYPSNAWAKGAAAFAGSDELWERLWTESVDVPPVAGVTMPPVKLSRRAQSPERVLAPPFVIR